MNPIVIISTAAFIGGLALVWAIHSLINSVKPKQAESRLHQIGKKNVVQRDVPSLLKSNIPQAHDDDGLLKVFSKFSARINVLFEQADVEFSAKSFVLLSLGTGFLGTAVAILMKSPVLLLPVVGLVFGILPTFWLFYRRRSRFRRFSRQLPDALELLSRALRSGHSLHSAMQVVSHEMLPPLATEFGVLAESLNLGQPIDEALMEMVERIPNEDLQFFATSVRLQHKSGGNLAEVLEKIAGIVRERFQILAQVQSLTGEGRLSGGILIVLPFVLFFTVYYLSPEYVTPLFTDPLGRKLTAGALVLQLVGGLAIKKIIDIKI